MLDLVQKVKISTPVHMKNKPDVDSLFDIIHTHRIRGPIPSIGYFPQSIRSKCKSDFFLLLSHFSFKEVKMFRDELQAGFVNGSSVITDALGTFAKIQLRKRRPSKEISLDDIINRRNRLKLKIGISPDLDRVNNNLEWWFFQIGGDETTGQAAERRRKMSQRNNIRKDVINTFGQGSQILTLLDEEDAGDMANITICLFTQITLEWIRQYVKHKRRARNGIAETRAIQKIIGNVISEDNTDG